MPRYLRWLVWLFAPVLLFLPMLFITRVQFLGNSDALFYSNILALMTESLAKGEFFPRWFANANAGFGSPVMMFYAPLAYIVTALINLPLAHFKLESQTQLLIGIYASQVVSGFTAWLWLRRSFAPRVAFVCSLLFVLLPYKLIYIYLHINLAQLWALALLPLWMMAAEDVADGDRRGAGFYALLFSAVYYTHPLTLIAFGVIPGIYALAAGRRNAIRTLTLLAVVHLLGIGMCLMQLLPAQAYLGWIHGEAFLNGNYNWRHNLAHVDVALCAYYGIIAVLAAFMLPHLRALGRPDMVHKGLFWLVLLTIAYFLTQTASAFLWEHITLLQYLQFPAARLHAAALMAVVYLIGLWLGYGRQMTSPGPVLYGKPVLVVLIGLFAVMTLNHVFIAESDTSASNAQYLGAAEEARIISTPVPLYKTRWGCIDAGRAYELYTSGKVPPPMKIVSGQAKLTEAVWQPPEHISLHADVTSGSATIAVRQCYIPLWQAQDGGASVPLNPGPDGQLTLTLLQGGHDIRITLAPSPLETRSRRVSLVCLILALLLLVQRRKLPEQA